jgi:hypothetical protein
MTQKKRKLKPLQGLEAPEMQPGIVLPPPSYMDIDEEHRGPIMVAIPTGRHNINSGTVKSLFSSQPYLNLFKGVMFYSHAGSLIQIARQESLNLALKEDVRWLWFIDDDMSFQPDTCIRLVKDCIENDFVMCSSLSIKRVPPFSPTVGIRTDDKGHPILTPEDVPEKGVHKVAHSGLACTVIDLNKIREKGLDKQKLFFLAVSEDNKRMIGEDLVFCDYLTQKGLNVGLDANMWTGHFGMHEFKPEMWFKSWRDIYIKQKLKNDG